MLQKQIKEPVQPEYSAVAHADLELVLPIAEALVQGLQLSVRVHSSCSSLLFLHLPDKCQVIIKQTPLALKLFLHIPPRWLLAVASPEKW